MQKLESSLENHLRELHAKLGDVTAAEACKNRDIEIARDFCFTNKILQQVKSNISEFLKYKEFSQLLPGELYRELNNRIEEEIEVIRLSLNEVTKQVKEMKEVKEVKKRYRPQVILNSGFIY